MPRHVSRRPTPDNPFGAQSADGLAFFKRTFAQRHSLALRRIHALPARQVGVARPG